MLCLLKKNTSRGEWLGNQILHADKYVYVTLFLSKVLQAEAAGHEEREVCAAWLRFVLGTKLGPTGLNISCPAHDGNSHSLVKHTALSISRDHRHPKSRKTVSTWWESRAWRGKPGRMRHHSPSPCACWTGTTETSPTRSQGVHYEIASSLTRSSACPSLPLCPRCPPLPHVTCSCT